MPKKTSLSNESNVAKHRTTPIKESLTSVPKYPTKLTLYKSEASPFWWVRYYSAHKIFRRSTKTLDKRVAIEFAKNFYDDINFKTHQGTLRGKEDNFEVCARAVIAQQEFQVKRNERSAERGCTEFCVNGQMAGNRRTSRSGYDRKYKESSAQRPHRQFAG